MTFAHPWALALLVIPIILGWTVVARSPGLTLPVDHAAHPRRRALPVILGIFDAAPLLLLAVALVILAGPQALETPRQERLLTNIQICLDVSGSMGFDSRHTVAADAIEDFTRSREGDAFGLTMFGEEQVRWIPLTKDLNAVRNALPFAAPHHQPPHMNGTMIGAAIRFCLRNMNAEAQDGDRLIILVSDGESFDLGNGEEVEIGDELSDAGITVYHIHVAESDPPEEVRELAVITGGDSFHAADAASLEAVFAHIDRMEPARFAALGAVPMDHFRPFATAMLGLLGVHTLGLLAMRYTPW